MNQMTRVSQRFWAIRMACASFLLDFQTAYPVFLLAPTFLSSVDSNGLAPSVYLKTALSYPADQHRNSTYWLT